MSKLITDVRSIYQKNAKIYDIMIKYFYPLIGLRFEKYRAHAVELLKLKRGDCVVDLGCGTGLNFSYLIKQIGTEGKLIGVDISSEMLNCALKKVKQCNWNNVELVHCDLRSFDYDSTMNAVLATGVFGYLDESAAVLTKLSKSLAPNARVVIVDGKVPQRWPLWAFNFFVWVSGSFGVTQEYFTKNTWEYMTDYLHDVKIEEAYGGLLYISSGVTHK